MLRLIKRKSGNFEERAEFKFSNFQALQVPKGWDKLFVSVISIKTGKTIATSKKAQVLCETCQWTDTLSEYIPLSQAGGVKGIEECLLKFVIMTGSGKAGILGEVALNLADYVDSSDLDRFNFLLNECRYDTILQMSIQCFYPKTKSRDSNDLRETSCRLESPYAIDGDIYSKPGTPGNFLNRSLLSSSSRNLQVASKRDEHLDRDVFFLSSNLSRESMENSVERSLRFPQYSINCSSYVGRQDISESSATTSAGPVDDIFGSNSSSFNSRAFDYSRHHKWQETAKQAPAHGHSSRLFRASSSAIARLDATEETIEVLREEAKMWERRAKKLKLDAEKWKNNCAFKSKQQAELDMELSVSNIERNFLRKEVEQLRLSMEELKNSLPADDEYCKAEGMLHFQKKLEDELKFLKESNDTLTTQLKKSQEANIELVAVLKDLEKTVEKQRLNLPNIDILTSVSKHEEGMRGHYEKEWANKLSAKEKGLNLSEPRPSKVQNAMQLSEIASNHDDPFLMQEITGKNMELTCNHKESRKDGISLIYNQSSSYTNILWCNSSDNSNYGLIERKAPTRQLEDELRRRDMDTVAKTMPSTLQMDEMEEKSGDIEIELNYFKNLSCDLEVRLHMCQMEIEQKKAHLNELQKELKGVEISNMGCNDASRQGSEIVKSWLALEMPRILCEMKKQLQLALAHARNLNNVQDPIAENCNETQVNVNVSSYAEATSQVMLVEDILNDIIKLNSSLQIKAEKKLITAEAMNAITDGILRKEQNNDLAELKLRNEMRGATLLLKENKINAFKASVREQQNNDLVELKLKNEVLEATLLVKENEIDTFKASLRGLEESMASQRESFLQEQRDQEQKINLAAIIMKQIDQEMMVESESLKQEITHLSTLVSSSHDELQRTAAAALREVSILRLDKNKLESGLQEVQVKVKLYETELRNLMQESDAKIETLVNLLNASKQSEEILIADIESMQRLTEYLKSSEEYFKRMANNLELKLDDCEKQHLTEDASGLNDQIRKVTQIQSEMVTLMSMIEEARLGEALCSFSEELIEHQALHESEKDGHSRVALEGMFLRLSSELATRAASCAQGTGMKHEVSQVKKVSNDEYRWKIQWLQKAKGELMRRARVLKKQLLQKSEEISEEEVSVITMDA